MGNKDRIQMLTWGGVAMALAAILSNIIIYQAPQGGSVSAGGMIPLLIFALKWGSGPGIMVGATFGILDFILKPYFFHPVQLILDYPLAYGLLGVAGIWRINIQKNKNEYLKIITGISLGIALRMISHIISGVVFFKSAAGVMNPWIYSLIYNSSYLLPELCISVFVIVLIWKPISSIINS